MFLRSCRLLRPNVPGAFARHHRSAPVRVQSYSSIPFVRHTIRHGAQRLSQRSARRRVSQLSMAEQKLANEKHSRYLLSTILGAASFATGTYIVYKTYKDPDAAPVNIVLIEPPKDEFQHPYNAWAKWEKVVFCIKRGIYLAYMWTPATFMSLLATVFKFEWLENYALSLTVRTLESCGMTFQKFGQWLSMRPDIFSPRVIEALATLCDDAKVHPFEDTKIMIRSSFGCEIEQLFEEFSEEPLASGSVAQVYKARLRPQYALEGGEQNVAVKIRHPKILDESFMDIEIIFIAMKLLPFLTIPFNKDSFLKTLQKQMDFEWEAFNMTNFATNFREETFDGVVRFPQISPDLISECVLVMSFAKGKPLSEMFSVIDNDGMNGWTVSGKKRNDVNMQLKKELAKKIFDINMKMFLRDNFVHGDMHGGNLLFCEGGVGGEEAVLTVLDAGLTVSLPDDVARSFSQFLYSMIMGDVDGIMSRLIEFNDSHTKVDITAFRGAIVKQVDTWVGERSSIPLTAPKAPDGGPISIGDLMGGILFSMQKYGVALRGDVASTLLTISISEGLIRQLDPEFDMCRGAMKYFVTFNDSAYSVIPSSEDVQEAVTEIAEEVIPDIEEVAGKVKDAIPDADEVKEKVEKTVEQVEKNFEDAKGIIGDTLGLRKDKKDP
eukprot:g3107.t1